MAVEYLALTPLALALLAALAGQILLAVTGVLACASAARDAALAAARGQDPEAAAHLSGHPWRVSIHQVAPVQADGIDGIEVRLALEVPLLPLAFMPAATVTATCQAAAPKAPVQEGAP